jgi:xylan 1,4-beta-xylosidase
VSVSITVDAAKKLGPLKPIWRFFGADEPNYAYMKDGKKLLKDLGKLGKPQVFFRAHSLLCTGDGTPALKWGSTNAYTEDAQGNPIYDWTIVDRIFDAYLKNNVKPYVQIGFMPKALSTKPEPDQHSWTPKAKYEEIYTGWAYPPKDWDKWGELVYQWTAHCVKKWGKSEVESWWWEVWNEANIGYWRGTPEEFRKLHTVAIAAVRRALPTARVGGSDVAGDGGQFQRDFFTHCLKNNSPLDFVSFHAKGAPTFLDGHVRMGIAVQLRTIDAGFKIIASYPELKNKPIVIGESDPDGCAACQGPQLGYRNSTMFSSYTAAVFASLPVSASSPPVWHYHDDELAGPDAEIALTLENLPKTRGAAKLTHWRIDENHSNVFTAWKSMGSPPKPTTAQYSQLEAASKLEPLAPPVSMIIEASRVMLPFTLPRCGVSLLQLEWR